mgnify:FL=1
MTDQRDVQLAEAVLDGRTPKNMEHDWWRGAVMYQIYLRSFRDSNGDGIGDLQGVVSKLDYLADLGVDAIWLSPFLKSPQEDFGYDVSDFRAVDPLFGTHDDLLQLIDGAHARGLRLLSDFVPCHTSVEHEWFEESRSSRQGSRADWYVWADPAADGGPPNNWLSSFGGGAWTWEPRRSQYYFHPFLSCQPALNLRNPEALGAIIDAMAYWRDFGIDGFRLDAIQCLCWDARLRSNPPRDKDEDDVAIGGGPENPFGKQTHLFDRDVAEGLEIIRRFRAELCDENSDFVLIGELADVDTSRLAVKYTAGRDRLHAVYDFDLIQKTDSVQKWIETLQVRSRFIRSGWLLNVLTNHDSERAVSNLTDFAVEAGHRAEAAKLLLFLQTMLRGGAIIFQGEELGLPQAKIPFEDMKDPWGINLYPDFEGRDGCRTPMPWTADGEAAGFCDGCTPWLPIGEGHRALAVDRQLMDNDSVLQFFRALLDWRAQNPWLLTASEHLFDASTAPVIAFQRIGEDRTQTFVANFSLNQAFFATDGRMIDFPHSSACMGENGLRLPPLGFGVIEDETPSCAERD